MDGRTQLPVIEYAKKRFNADYVDMITEAGPNRILAEQTNTNAVQSILNRLSVSVHHHKSKGLVIVGHHECAGNPAGEYAQAAQTRKAIAFLRNCHSSMEIIGVWVDEHWQVHEIEMQ